MTGTSVVPVRPTDADLGLGRGVRFDRGADAWVILLPGGYPTTAPLLWFAREAAPGDWSQRPVGQWPAEDQYAALMQVLERQIAASGDPAERTKLERLRDAATGLGEGMVATILNAWAPSLAGPPM